MVAGRSASRAAALLSDGRKNKFILGASWATRSQSTEPQDALHKRFAQAQPVRPAQFTPAQRLLPIYTRELARRDEVWASSHFHFVAISGIDETQTGSVGRSVPRFGSWKHCKLPCSNSRERACTFASIV